MPASRSPLPTNELQTIVQWIRNGARNDAGAIPFPEPRPFGKVFFSSQSVDLVGVLDVSTNLIMRYTTVGNSLPFNATPESPHNVQIDDQGRFYYVTLIRSNRLRKFDAVTQQLVGEVTVGTSPAHVVITADGTKAYVTNFDQSFGRVFAVNTATMTISKTISSSQMKGTHGARLSNDGKYLYVGSNGLDLINIILVERDSLVATIPVAGDVPPFGSFVHKPYQIAVRSDDQFIYTTLNGTGRVSIIERTGDTFRLFSDSIRVGLNPLQCEVSRDKRFLYVCNRGSRSVSVIDALNNRFLTTVVEVGPQPHGIDISDDSRTVYVTCENISSPEPPHHPTVGSTAPGFLSVIDVGTQSVIRKIEIGGFGAGVSVYPGKGN
jgi:YVTN family beta-propeller protein